MSKPRTLSILALTGGGILARYSSEVLRDLQTRRNSSTGPGNPSSPLAQAFDVMAGTSAGSLCIAGLLVGRSPDQLCTLLDEQGPLIFRRSRFLRAKWFITAKYSRKPLEDAVDAAMGGENPELGEFSQILAFPAIDETDGRPVVFTNTNEAHKKILLRDAVLASSAAPTYFRPHLIRTTRKRYVDGGLYANAPDLAAIILARKAWPHIELHDLHLVSIGTTLASAASPHGPGHPGAGGILSWAARPPGRILKLSMQCQTENAVALLHQMQLGDFIRIDEEINQAKIESLDIDNASREALSALASAGKTALQRLTPSETSRLNMILGRMYWRSDEEDVEIAPVTASPSPEAEP